MSFFNNAKTITFAGKAVTKLELAGKKIWEAVTFKNWVKFSTESDGTTIYNSGLGYKTGYRVRSGGAEGTASGNFCTGFIPCKAGDVIRFCYSDGLSLWTDFTTYHTFINFSNSSKTNLGQFTSQPATYGIFANTDEYSKVTKIDSDKNIWEYTVPDNADIAFVRFTSVHYSSRKAENFIITVNEEIT